MINLNMSDYFLSNAFSVVPRNGWPVCYFTFWSLLSLVLSTTGMSPLFAHCPVAPFFFSCHATSCLCHVAMLVMSFVVVKSRFCTILRSVSMVWYNTTRRHVAGGFIAFRPFKQGSVTQTVECLGSCHVLLISIWQLSFSHHINLGLCQTTW